MKRIARVVAVAGVVAITLFGVAWVWLLGVIPPLGGREAVPGLRDSVVVLWDSLGVPHIVAGTDLDAFTTLGYLHARDRLWQLELLRHAAMGRLSELFGPATIEADRDLRELEIPSIAAARVAKAGTETRTVLEAYAAGVNAWIARGVRPVELRLLRHAPERWLPVHSLAVGVLQAWDLRTTGDEGELAVVASRLGVARALDLLPEFAHHAAAIPGSGPGWPSDLAPRGPEMEARPGASNAWAIAGSRTRSGKPMLANDPHLTLRVPSIWYLAGAHAPTYHIVGATIPGVPVVVLGHTRSVAWGLANAMVDDVDYVVEQLSADSTRYRTPRGWAPVETVAETVAVRRGLPVTYTRRRTERGPLTARWVLDGHRAYAIRWVAQDGGADEVAALLAMARARDATALRAATSLFRSPEQDVVYADSAGTIGYILAGRVPRRRRGDAPLPAPAWSHEGDAWMGWEPDATLPRAVNPPSGWIVRANNRHSPGQPYFLSRHYDHSYRAERIAELLRMDSLATIESVSSHQMDVVDLFARRVRGVAARSALAVRRPDVADRLRGWDGAMESGAVEPALLWRWYREVERLVFEDDLPGYWPDVPLHAWIRQGRSPWFDDIRTPEVETLDTIARRAMARVLAERSERTWGDLHATVMKHPLAHVPLLGRLIGFGLGPFPSGGSTHTINNSSTSERRAPFASSYGASLRHVVDFGDLDGGGFILPTGQSGHPGSPHYRDQTARWRRGDLWGLPLDVARVHVTGRLVLTPARAPGLKEKPPRVSPGGLSLARHRAP